MAATAAYVLGHSDAELRRLATQARLIDPITRRFLVSAGIAGGMRVLDVGSGAGDVAILTASLVGPTGEVVGTDMALTAISTATQRASAAGLTNSTFRHGDPTEMTFERPFDAIVGRYVLQFIDNPSAALGRLARQLVPGGIIVFHELDWDGARSAPRVPTYDLACRWANRTIELTFPQAHLGPRLASVFAAAGLPAATMQLESVVASGRAAGDVIHLVTDFVPTLLPTMERVGVATPGDVELPTLAERIAAEVGADATLIGRAEVATWTRV